MIPMRSAIFYFQTIKVRSEIVRCLKDPTLLWLSPRYRSLIQAGFGPVHHLLAACFQPVLERIKLLAHSAKTGKDGKKLPRPSF